MSVNSKTKNAIYATSIMAPIKRAHLAPNQTVRNITTVDPNITPISAGSTVPSL